MTTPVTLTLTNGTPSTVKPTPPAFGKFCMGVNIGGMENIYTGKYPGNTMVWNQPTQSDFEIFPPLGITLARLLISWTGLQEAAGDATLNSSYVNYIVQAIQAANQAGMECFLDMHDFGYGPKGTSGQQYLIGTTTVTTADFGLVWQLLAQALKTAGVSVCGYSLMNEPQLSESVWIAAAQAAINGIRSADTASPIILDGLNYSSPVDYASANPGFFSTLTDPSNLLICAAHFYFDYSGTDFDWPTVQKNNNATITTGPSIMESFVEALDANPKFGGILEEFGYARNNTGWLMAGYNMLAYCQQNNLWVTGFSTGPEPPDDYAFFLGRPSFTVPQLAVMNAFTGIMPSVPKGIHPMLAGSATPNSKIYLTRLSAETYQTNQAVVISDESGAWSHTLTSSQNGVNIYVASDSPMEQNSVASLATVCFEHVVG